MTVTEIQKQFDLFSNMYRAMSNVLASLPLHPDLIKSIAHDIDTAFLWVKEGMQAASAFAQAEESKAVETVLPAGVKIEGVEDVPGTAPLEFKQIVPGSEKAV